MKRIIAVAVALFSMITLVYPVRADWPAPGGPWSTSIRIENKTTGQVQCIYVFVTSTVGDSRKMVSTNEFPRDLHPDSFL